MQGPERPEGDKGPPRGVRVSSRSPRVCRAKRRTVRSAADVLIFFCYTGLTAPYRGILIKGKGCGLSQRIHGVPFDSGFGEAPKPFYSALRRKRSSPGVRNTFDAAGKPELYSPKPGGGGVVRGTRNSCPPTRLPGLYKLGAGICMVRTHNLLSVVKPHLQRFFVSQANPYLRFPASVQRKKGKKQPTFEFLMWVSSSAHGFSHSQRCLWMR